MPAAWNTPASKWIRPLLGSLLLVIALNALGGGYYGMAGAKNVPVAWLAGSPFHNYFIPSLFLFVVVGGAALLAAIAVFRKRSYARPVTFLCSSIMITWILVQVAVIGPVSWLQPVTIIAALLIFILAWLLSKHDA